MLESFLPVHSSFNVFLSNHTFQTNPNSNTNLSKRFNYICSLRRYFLYIFSGHTNNGMSQGNETENQKKSKQSRQRFAFERVYGRDASQQELFEETVRPSIVSAVEGYNVTVFAYGQTGTGKTYTMEGHMEDTEKAGIIPRSVYSVFDILESTCLPGDYTVTVSHLEIYQEELHDLLSPHNEAESLTARLSKKRYTTSLALAQAMQKKGIQMTYDPKTNKASAVDAMRNGRLIGPMADILRSRIMKARLEEVELDKKRKLTITSDEDKGVYITNLTERRGKYSKAKESERERASRIWKAL